MAFITLKDNYGREKKIPMVKGPIGEDIYNSVKNINGINNSSTFSKELATLQVPYKIGQFYFSILPTSPGSRWGGTWEQVTNVFLIGASVDQTNGKYKFGDKQGSKEVTLTLEQIPSHSHSGPYVYSSGSGGYMTEARSSSGSNNVNMNTWGAGSSQAHNNMPPYVIVYVWKRTA